MPIYAFEGKKPKISKTTYVAPTAVIIGDVTIGERCYIGHHVVLRGDYGAILIEDESALEDGVIVHALQDDKARIGPGATVGHGAKIHTATVCKGAVVGIGSVISDYAEVGAGAIVGEMGLVKNSQEVPPMKVAVGVPVQVIGDVGEHHELLAQRARYFYIDFAERYAKKGLVELDPHMGEETSIVPMIPIGMIRTPFEHSVGTPIQGSLSGNEEGEVIVEPAFEEGLSDLDGFSHVILLYTFHQMEGFQLKIKPFLDTEKRGCFATRSPSRPNPIGMTTVRLLGIKGCRLKVSGVDMLDGSPLLDIKPYVPLLDSHEAERCGWYEPYLEKLARRSQIPVADDRFQPKHAAPAGSDEDFTEEIEEVKEEDLGSEEEFTEDFEDVKESDFEDLDEGSGSDGSDGSDESDDSEEVKP